MNNKQFGNYGEDLACKYLLEQGYEILERNKHYSKFCEIDIIAKRKEFTVFVEVKTRHNNDFGNPLEAVNKTKLSNILKGVRFYIAEHNIKKYRIDVIGITLKPDLKIEHLRNVAVF